MRRQLLSQSTFQRGYSDSVNPFLASPETWAAGSSNIVLMGDSKARPFKGLYSKGTGSGVNYATQFGDTWGGLSNYSSVSGQGSILETYNSTAVLIGAGKANKEGSLLQVDDTTFTFVAGDVNTGTGSITEASHGMQTGQVLYITTTGTMPLGLVTTTPYWVIRIDANTFRVASSYFNAQAGTPITGGTTGSGTMTVHTGSVTGSVIDGIPASSLLQVCSQQVATYLYTYVDEAGLDQAETPTVTVPTTPGISYTGIVNGAVNFKIAAMRDRQNVGVNIDNPNAPVKGRSSSATAVVIPNNKTVKITFPTAQTGQTHWAVFSTQEGFGGTGNFYRLGYRTSSDTNATWYFGISETTVAAASGRTLEFDYRTGDLLPELAWIEDYPPPAGTHAARLENLMVVFGCYDGTVAAVSLPNFFESYNPRHLLYFPEAVTAVLHRPVDNYCFVACRNSIHAVQYVGYRDDELPAATITTVTPDVGIAHQWNWALGGGNICMFIEGTGIVMMSPDGSIDFEFARDVNLFVEDWLALDTVVSFDQTSRTFIIGNGTETVSFSMETGTWRTPFYLTDAGTTGDMVSGINASGQLIITLDNGGTQTAYVWDDNTSTTRMQTSAISQWQTAPMGRSVRLFEGDMSLRSGTNAEPLVIGFHTNLFTTHVRGCSVTSASDAVTVPSGTFQNDGLVDDKQFALFGLNIGNLTFTASDVTDLLTVASTANMVTGQAVTVSNSGGALPGGLAAATTYYVIIISATTLKLATSLANAYAGTAINLTTTGSGTNTIVINFLVGSLEYASATSVNMLDRNTGDQLNSAANASNCLMLVGDDFFIESAHVNLEQHALNIRPALTDVRSWCMSVVQITDANRGQVYGMSVFGTGVQSSVVNVT